MSGKTFEIFLIVTPGLENQCLAEAVQAGFATARRVEGGVCFDGTWPDVWRANLELRGVTRVLARLASFHANHLAQLDKRARDVPWADVLRKATPVRIEAACRRSKIYHSGAAAQRVATAITDECGISVSDEAPVTIMVRIEKDLVTISVDTSGEILHKRGSKQAMAKAPLRETMAALFLRACAYDGREPVFDPLCGSGTFVIEAAEMAAGLMPGRNRHFAFEMFKTFDQAQWDAMRKKSTPIIPAFRFHGSDRDQGAIAAARANAMRAGLEGFTQFTCQAVSEARPPDGAPGLVIMNPPYGARIGDKKKLHGLYGAIGKTMRERFMGWRVGVIATDKALIAATGLPFKPPGEPVLHGGLRIRLWQTGVL